MKSTTIGLLICLLIISCAKSPTEPESPKPPEETYLFELEGTVRVDGYRAPDFYITFQWKETDFEWASGLSLRSDHNGEYSLAITDSDLFEKDYRIKAWGLFTHPDSIFPRQYVSDWYFGVIKDGRFTQDFNF